MKRVHAILHEPASYTVDRNRSVYDPLGITYSYIRGHSDAKTKVQDNSESKVLATRSYFKLWLQLLRILRNNDIIIVNGYNGRVFILLFLSNFFYKRSIGIDSDTRLRIPGNRLKRWIKNIYLNIIFRNKNVYGLPGGTETHSKLFKYYGMDDTRIYLMPMMVNNSQFKTIKHTGTFRFIFVGRLIPEKNLPFLIDTFNTTFGNDPNVELCIIGDGPQRDQLMQMSTKVNNIIFVGPCYGDSLINEYSNASALILPSISDQWGLVVNEALSTGLPVIVSDQVGAAYDLVEVPKTGFIFKYDDKDDLGNKMKKLVYDKSLYEKCSLNAVELMNNHWNYDYYRECLIKFIENAK